MKSIFVVALLASLLMGCAKEEVHPTPVQQPEVRQSDSNCWTGTILLIENDYTIFETPVDSTGHKRRLARSGHWGQVGDTFDYCD